MPSSTSLGAVVHVARAADGLRRVEQVGVPTTGADGLVEVRTALRHGAVGVTEGPAADDLRRVLERGRS
ncbi:hypothetical protein ACSDQ9_04335 [Aestuariimicrobium soli]|uniref:hypothetical protein n=1 Tax=Aestuariimicrobium soli TaxID=2035834 RepID=UPI003EB87AEC